MDGNKEAERRDRWRTAASTVACLLLAGCLEAHNAAPADSATPAGNVTSCDGPAPQVGTPCAFGGRCPMLFTDWVDGMCGDEGYECREGHIAEYENLRLCGSPFPVPGGPCSAPDAVAEPFEVNGTTPGGAPEVITQACTSSVGWGDCHGGMVSVEVLSGSDTVLATVELVFDSSDAAPAERTCWFRPAVPSVPASPCSFHGLYDLAGTACGGDGTWPRVCGELAVDAGDYVFEATVALTATDVALCF